MVTIAIESLGSCMGCEMSLLDNDEAGLDMFRELTFVRAPFLADKPNPTDNSIPIAAVGVVLGAVRLRGHIDRLRELRSRVDVLLAGGTCAVTGGMPAMAHLPGTPWQQWLDQRVHTVPGPDPKQDDELLPHCLPASHYVRVDLEIPGCPPNPEWIAECLLSLLDTRFPCLPQRSVCDTCPAKRSGTPPLDGTLFRMLSPIEGPPPHGTLEDLPCLLEQGFMCMGPVTRAGCGGKDRTPRCVKSYTPCRGCYGPAHNKPQPLADYAGVLAAAGHDISTMPDKAGFLSRYSGTHFLKNYPKED